MASTALTSPDDVFSDYVSSDYVSTDYVEFKEEDKVYRMPPLFRSKQSHQHAYHPVIVSMGPYYHGRQEYQHAEDFKLQCLNDFITEYPNDDYSYYYNKIVEKIGEIRSCYEKLDDELADADLAS